MGTASIPVFHEICDKQKFKINGETSYTKQQTEYCSLFWWNSFTYVVRTKKFCVDLDTFGGFFASLLTSSLLFIKTEYVGVHPDSLSAFFLWNMELGSKPTCSEMKFWRNNRVILQKMAGWFIGCCWDIILLLLFILLRRTRSLQIRKRHLTRSMLEPFLPQSMSRMSCSKTKISPW